MLFPGNLPVLCRGIEAGVPQVFLEKPEPVSRVVLLDGVDRKGVPKPVRAYAMHPTGLRVHQAAEDGPVSAVPDHPPGPGGG